jgi:hypothetical protein
VYANLSVEQIVWCFQTQFHCKHPVPRIFPRGSEWIVPQETCFASFELTFVSHEMDVAQFDTNSRSTTPTLTAFVAQRLTVDEGYEGFFTARVAKSLPTLRAKVWGR